MLCPNCKGKLTVLLNMKAVAQINTYIFSDALCFSVNNITKLTSESAFEGFYCPRCITTVEQNNVLLVCDDSNLYDTVNNFKVFTCLVNIKSNSRLGSSEIIECRKELLVHRTKIASLAEKLNLKDGEYRVTDISIRMKGS